MADATSILLIEDNNKVRRYYAEHLKRICPSYVIVEAVTGRTGLDLYQWQIFDCVVLDLSLPDMSGFEVLAKLVPTPSQPRVPVIILSSTDSRALLEVAKPKGAFAALQKDLTSGDDLDRIVRSAMAAIPVNGEKALARLTIPSHSAFPV
jgi:CheY-like chemotaxis protein